MLETLLGLTLVSPFIVWVTKDCLADVAYWRSRKFDEEQHGGVHGDD